jgi:hypothetical protein
MSRRSLNNLDDFLLGFAGPRREAEQIKSKIGEFLRDELTLDLFDSKTLITHAASQAARFLGYEIRTQRADTRSPATVGPSTAPSACSCHGMSSGNDAPAT